MLHKVIGIFVFFLLSQSIFAADIQVGNIQFLQGTIGIVRNGKTVAANQIGLGFAIYNLDQIRVSSQGRVEISFDPKTTLTGFLTLQSDTILTINLSALQGNKQTQLDLLTGSISLKVNKLINGSVLTIQSGNAVMAVRGTTFDVTISPAGDILLSTEEGKVSCMTPGGKEFFSTKDNVVFGTWDDRWSNENVPFTTLAKFRQDWVANRLKDFRTAPIKTIRQFSNRYIIHVKEFNEAWLALLKNNDILIRWIKEDQAGNIGTDIALRKVDIDTLQATIMQAKEALRALERARYRLLQIREFLSNKDLEIALDDGKPVRIFFDRLGTEASQVSKRVDTMYYYLKLFEIRSLSLLALEPETTIPD
jgi:hypothetical protein